MNKEEIKQWIRSQIETSIKIQHDFINNVYYLCYNKNYLRVLKLSKITDQPVNKENFKGGEKMFWVNTNLKDFWIYLKISDYLEENYSKDH